MLRLAIFFLTLALQGLAASADQLVQEGLAAEKRLESEQALTLFRDADAQKPENAFILQKIAKQYSDLVPSRKTDDAKREYATRALDYAQRSFKLEPTNAVYALSLAICHGHLASVSDARAKAEYSRLIKQESERSLALDPNYAWAHHVLGRWHLEVAELSGVALFFVKIFYGGLPPASREEAVSHLQRATELEPGELNHWIYLGFAYAAVGRKEDARAAWDKGLAMPKASPHDDGAKERARAALAKL